jgi:hypothetical protein
LTEPVGKRICPPGCREHKADMPTTETGPVSLARRAAETLDGLGPFGRRLADFCRDLRLDMQSWEARQRAPADHLKRQYRAVFGRDPDLDAPRSFNEKMQWLKLHDRSPLHTRCADKLAVRDYVRETIPETDILIPLLAVLDDPAELTQARIVADRFAAKATHDSGSTQLCWDRDRFDWARARRRLNRALRRDFSAMFGEWQYRDVPRRIVVEAMIDSAAARDYKIFCFNGEPGLIMVNIDRFGDFRENFYDTAWQQQDFIHTYPPSAEPIGPPRGLATMLDYARRLSAPFAFARTDFYEDDGQVWFGEITFHQSAGLQPFRPESIDIALGDRLVLPTKA